MAILAVSILALVILVAALLASHSAEVWCAERRRDAKLAVAGVGILFLFLGMAVVIVPPRARVWEMIVVPPIVAALGVGISLSLIAVNLLLIDHVTGRAEMGLRTMFGSGGENIQRHIPLYSLRTPLYVLRGEERHTPARR